ncbi:MAG: hypothetical protein EAZ97_04190 [Bacteroidetes bacterium]|nr:MAG: hypothetical protein EAZ97_04190 [Bacteroidota bacterium]
MKKMPLVFIILPMILLVTQIFLFFVGLPDELDFLPAVISAIVLFWILLTKIQPINNLEQQIEQQNQESELQKQQLKQLESQFLQSKQHLQQTQNTLFATQREAQEQKMQKERIALTFKDLENTHEILTEKNEQNQKQIGDQLVYIQSRNKSLQLLQKHYACFANLLQKPSENQEDLLKNVFKQIFQLFEYQQIGIFSFENKMLNSDILWQTSKDVFVSSQISMENFELFPAMISSQELAKNRLFLGFVQDFLKINQTESFVAIRLESTQKLLLVCPPKARNYANEELFFLKKTAELLVYYLKMYQFLAESNFWKKQANFYKNYWLDPRFAVARFQLDEPISTKISVEEQINLIHTDSKVVESNQKNWEFEGLPQVWNSAFRANKRLMIKYFVENNYFHTDFSEIIKDNFGKAKQYFQLFQGIVENNELTGFWYAQIASNEVSRQTAELLESEKLLKENKILLELEILAKNHQINKLEQQKANELQELEQQKSAQLKQIVEQKEQEMDMLQDVKDQEIREISNTKDWQIKKLSEAKIQQHRVLTTDYEEKIMILKRERDQQINLLIAEKEQVSQILSEENKQISDKLMAEKESAIANLTKKNQENMAELRAKKDEIIEHLEQNNQVLFSKIIKSEKLAILGKLVAISANQFKENLRESKKKLPVFTENLADLNELIDHYSEINPEISLPEKLSEIKYFKESIEFEQVLIENKVFLEIFAKKIQKNTDLANILNSFSDLSQVFTENINLSFLLDSLLVLLENTQIEIIRKYPSDLQISGTANLLAQLFMNIIFNAFEAIKGQGKIWIEGVEFAEKIIITIKDTGIGMSQEVVNQAFTPFFTNKNPELYLGLGLSVSKQIAAQHQGEIQIQSQEQKGTEVQIFLQKISN